MFFENDNHGGFLLATYDVVNIENHPDLESYDFTKYTTLLNSTKINAPLIWLELICVHQDFRSKNIAKTLIEELKTDAKNTYFTDENIKYIVIGIDIAGTANNLMNKSLANFYQKLGFKILFDSGFDVYTGGALLGYLQIER